MCVCGVEGLWDLVFLDEYVDGLGLAFGACILMALGTLID